MVLRFGVLIVVLVLAYSLLFFQVFRLQIVKGDYYLAQEESEYSASGVLNATRGVIYFVDKAGKQLSAASNKDLPMIYAVPKVIDDASEAANIFASVLSKSVAALEAVFSKSGDSYEVLVKKAPGEMAKQVDDLKIKGVYVKNETYRFYPLGSMASHVLGFVGPASDGPGEIGHYGVEEFYEKELSGSAGTFLHNKVVAVTPGKDLVLTIDPNIQSEAEKILNSLVSAHGASGGSVMVEDPKTGKILAMGSYPNFDPNNYSQSPLADFLNPATQQIYEPGSVFKIITMAAGIDSGKITPDTIYYDSGSVTLNGKTIQNYDLKTHGPYGKATMTNVIEHSINTGAVFAERTMGRDVFTNYLHNFGFSEKTDIGLPGEVGGDLRRLSSKEPDIAFATASYGQGVAVTPIELVNAAAAIANGGNLMRPYLDASLHPKIIRRVVKADTAQAVTGMMVSAVDKAGIATISGYSLAGKTGSAYIPDFKKGGYTDKLIDSYAGFGPTSNPRFVILFKVNGLDQSQLAATIIVPAFRDLAQFILNYYGIAPDRF